MKFILDNLATIIVTLILVLITVLIVMKMVRDRRSGKGGCSCGKKSFTNPVLKELFSPGTLFRFAAFSFAVIMSSGFMIKTINMIIGALVK